MEFPCRLQREHGPAGALISDLRDNRFLGFKSRSLWDFVTVAPAHIDNSIYLGKSRWPKMKGFHRVHLQASSARHSTDNQALEAGKEKAAASTMGPVQDVLVTALGFLFAP